MKTGLKRGLRFGVTLAIIALVIVFATRVDWGDIWDRLRTASPWPLLLATVINLLSLGIKGVRWWLFLRPLGVCSLGMSMRATAAGAGLNNVLVANAGEAARVMFISRAAGRSSAGILAALTLERTFDVIGYVTLLAVATLVLHLPEPVARFRWGAILLLLFVAAALVYVFIRPPRAPNGEAVASVAADSLLARIKRYGAHFGDNLRGLLTGPRAVAALALSLVSWAMQVATYHLAAIALHFPIPLAGTVTVLLTENLGFLLRATPGNVGVFQVVYALTAGAMGLSESGAVAVAVLLQALQVVPVTLLGVALAPEFVFRHRRKAVPPVA